MANQVMSLEVHEGALRRNCTPHQRSSWGLRLGLPTRHFSVPSPAVPHVEDQMGRLYFGEVKFLFGMAFPGFRGSFHGSACFWQIGIRRIPIIGKIDSRHMWWKQGPFGTGQRDSIRKAGGAYSLSNILLAGGQ